MQQIQTGQVLWQTARDRASDRERDTSESRGRAGGKGKGKLVPSPNNPHGRNAEGALGSLSLTLALTHPTRQYLRAADQPGLAPWLPLGGLPQWAVLWMEGSRAGGSV